MLGVVCALSRGRSGADRRPPLFDVARGFRTGTLVHPDLRVLVLECGGGWIAHWMDRLDEFLESYSWAVPGLSLKPSEYFQRQCVVSFDPGEHTAPLLHDLAGADTFIWASDFPHSDAKYPGVVDELTEYTEGMAPDARAALFGLNAARLYGLEA